jgi:hypothetical protein
MLPEINGDRRRFLRAAAMIIAVGELGIIPGAHAQSTETHPAGLPIGGGWHWRKASRSMTRWNGGSPPGR